MVTNGTVINCINLLKMGTTMADEYYLKAWSNYPYYSEEILEPLNYALSYDEEHAPSLCLMARLQMELLKNYKASRHYYECALIADPNYLDTYKYYTLLLIEMGELENAERILKQGEGKVGFSKVLAISTRANILACGGNLKEAIALLKNGKLIATDSKSFEYFNGELSRLKKKVKKHKSKKK